MLKSLELVGFKSFADKTRFDFDPGITGIVGPNGSGKSNVVDAIKWILGDQSPKSMRGKEMTDVIFNGSATRKPAGFAEATLVFSNTDRHFRIDTDEVAVGRRIYRSGEAEYLINRAPARLKDVRELFMGTGAGTAAYSIIEQGRVDALLQATAASRRVVFEEAAGISRFKQRKVEAQRKLERVDQNLLRIRDIVEEVRVQLETLRTQAARAARYREIHDELRTLRIALAADDERQFALEAAALDRRREDAAAELAEVELDHQAAEAEHKAIDARLLQQEQEWREVERAATERREAIAAHEASMGYQQIRLDELDVELQRLREQQDLLEQRARAVDAELEAARSACDSGRAELAQRRAACEELAERLQQFEADLANLRQDVEESRARRAAVAAEQAALQNLLSLARERRQGRERERERIAEQLAELAQNLREAADKHQAQQQACDAAAVRPQRLRDELLRLTEAHAAVSERADAERKRLSALRERRGALLARKSVLEDLDQRHEGLGVGVRELLQQSRRAAASPWTQFRGTASDLLAADMEYAALLDVLLAAHAGTILVADLEPIVEALQRGTLTVSQRVGFLPILLAEPGEGRDLSQEPGVVARADRLIPSPPDHPGLARQLLGDTWVVESLADARRLAAGIGRGLRFATLQGEVLERDGTLFAGLLAREAAPITRRTELRSLRLELQEIDEQMAAVERLVQQSAEEQLQLEAAQRQKNDEWQQATVEAGELRAALQAEKLALDDVRRRHAETAARLEAWDRGDDLSSDAPHGAADLRKLEEELRRIDAEMAEKLQELERGTAAAAAWQAELQDAKLELARRESALSNLDQARLRLEQERDERQLQQAEAERRLAAIVAKQHDAAERLRTGAADRLRLVEERDAFDARLASFQATRTELRAERERTAERERELRGRRRVLQEELHTLELRRRELQQRRDHAAERLREEHQVQLDAVGKSDASAVRLIWEQLRPHLTAEQPHPSGLLPAGDTPFEALSAEQLAVLRAEAESRLDRLKRRLKQLGAVNTESLHDLDELESRYKRLDAQYQDLTAARNSLDEIIRRINVESRKMFVETFEEIRKHFRDLFRKLFGGGNGDVVLEDPDDVLDCGIDVVARPPGKELRSISLLSGGEKTLTAVALLMAIFRSKPSPFCILDEVDAALDEGNIERYMKVIQEFQDRTQFIVITHSKRTMTATDVLYGVTMQESGVSTRMSVRFDDISEDGQIRRRGTAA